MAVAPAPGKENNSQIDVWCSDSVDWVRIAAACSLLAGGLLYIAGQRRTAMAAAATGTALALLDQQELLSTWWDQLPGYVDHVQQLLDDVQNLMEDFSGKREQLRDAIGKVSNAI